MLPFPIPRRLSEGFTGLLRAVFATWANHVQGLPQMESSSAAEEVSEESEETLSEE